MNAKQLRVRMLGSFSIELGDKKIDDSWNRSRKVWLLLAYMIYYRNRPISQEELTGLLWGEEESSANPANALKTMFHRVRTMLDQLEEYAGHHLIVRQRGGYAWNPEISIRLDLEEFDNLCRAGAAAAEDERLQRYLGAIELYQGDFLTKLSTEPWVVPIATYFHNLYTHAVQEALLLLEERNRREEAIRLCRKAVEVEPYNEDLYRHLMRNLVDMKDQRGAIAVYEDMSELLFSNFGVMPAEDIRALYREAVRVVNDRAIPLGVVRDQLRETETAAGALFCDYDFFKVLYHAEARLVARRGDAIHIGLLSILGKGGKELSKRSMGRAMENLQEQVRLSLRRGDVAAQCSVSQYILMLPQANYENSCMVCERIIKAFGRQYPHSPAELNYSVQPLEPST
ncbi:MAG: BTAD domain-containing putative transcriptional regulator [Lawsonibacter sp.]|nr:BTAD domain-containing putative transcriptional regulator [Lawsonibacter sp.]